MRHIGALIDDRDITIGPIGQIPCAASAADSQAAIENRTAARNLSRRRVVDGSERQFPIYG